jgi:hypothetical protein
MFDGLPIVGYGVSGTLYEDWPAGRLRPRGARHGFDIDIGLGFGVGVWACWSNCSSGGDLWRGLGANQRVSMTCRILYEPLPWPTATAIIQQAQHGTVNGLSEMAHGEGTTSMSPSRDRWYGRHGDSPLRKRMRSPPTTDVFPAFGSSQIERNSPKM